MRRQWRLLLHDLFVLSVGIGIGLIAAYLVNESYTVMVRALAE